MHNILFLTHRPPFPPDKGDRIRSWNLLKQLSKYGEVRLACTADEPPSAAVAAHIDRFAGDQCVVPLGKTRWARAAFDLAIGRSATEGLFASRLIHRQIAKWHAASPFSVAVVFCSSMFPYVYNLPRDLPVLFDCVDVDSVKFSAYAEKSNSLKGRLYGLEAHRLSKLEKAAARRSQLVTLVSEEEAKLFREIHGVDNVQGIPNGVDLDYFHPSEVEELPNSTVFVGMMDYPPNVQAALWYGEHVFPGLRDRFPDATFWVVGRNPTPSLIELGKRPGIEVTGGVDDVRPYVARSAVVVAPLQIARGIQNKVLEAMSMAKPVVATQEAMTGLRVAVGDNILTGSDGQDWLTKISALFEEEPLRRSLGQAARLYVEHYHHWDQCLEPFGRILDNLPSNGNQL